MLSLLRSSASTSYLCRSRPSPTRTAAAEPAEITEMQQVQQQSILELPETLQTLRLKDGRHVSISIGGDPDGKPVLFLHPIQGNRYMPLTMHKAAASLGLKIIALDRPGVGESSPLPIRSVQQYPADVAELCDQMGIKQFSVFASSAGTMYGLALTVAPETKHMVVGKVTIIAPWIPNSSRAPGFGGWLSLLGSWTPVPLLHIAIGFSNRRLAQQAKRRKQFRRAVKHNTPRHAAWASWLAGSAADVASAGVSCLKHTAHFVMNDYISSCSSSSSSTTTTTTKTKTTAATSQSCIRAVYCGSSMDTDDIAAPASDDTSSPIGSTCSSSSRGSSTPVAERAICSCSQHTSSSYRSAITLSDGRLSLDFANKSGSSFTTPTPIPIPDRSFTCACGKTSDSLKPTSAACSLTCLTVDARALKANCRTYSLNSMTTDTFAIGTTDTAHSCSPSRSFIIATCHPPMTRRNSSLSSMSDSSSASGTDGSTSITTAHKQSCTAIDNARDKPITELMTHSTDMEKAAFAADPCNDAIYKAMIEQWTPSLSGIIQEMQLCTERSSKLHFNYIQDIAAPVRVYSGTADEVLLHSHVQHWADSTSNVELISVEGGTHDGLMHTHKVAALQALAQDLGSFVLN